MGRAAGQQGDWPVCLPNNPGVIRSAKAAWIWTRQQDEEIWAGERRVEELPAEIQPGEVVVVGSGGAYAAVRVLTRTDIGRAAPLRLREIQGDLVLEIYNYLGQEKSFWEMGWPGAFLPGQAAVRFLF